MANRHIALALVVAPLLSVLAWWAAGALLGQKPAPAQTGHSYPLVASSNCRWASGECHLENADLVLKLTLVDAARPTLRVSASHPVDAVLVSVGSDADARPDRMLSLVGMGQSTHWQLQLPEWPSPDARIRLATQAGGSNWYGETGLAFPRRH